MVKYEDILKKEMEKKNSESQPALTNFWIELRETQSGHQILSATIQGKHWKGFLEERQGTKTDGSNYAYKSAQMKPCTWEKCQICHPEDIFV